ncbi:aldo/keto reductase [Roseateles noduli]|uniref:aldo/keto reductase n=1 Tax=Roseateles noduli TaxID=2052484 RepID=UPI003D65A1EB
MEYRNIGGTDLKVSVLSFGTATFGGGNEFFKAWGETDVAEATQLVSAALESGINLFDTADVYSDGAAETILGKAIAGRRDELLISTKGTFRMGPGPDDIGSSRKHIVEGVEASLKRLGTDRIDLWQLHAFDAMTPIEETLRALDDLVKAGKIRYIGCSNFSGWHLMKSLSISEQQGLARHVAHQAYYSLLAREYEWELMPLAKDQNVGTVVWSPLSGGRLSGKISRDTPAPAGSRSAQLGAHGPELPEAQFFDLVDVLKAISKEVERSVSQVALNWVLQRPTISTLIIGARNEQQLRDNVGAADFKLTAEQIKRLDDVSATRPVYPYWHQRDTFSERNPAVV